MDTGSNTPTSRTDMDRDIDGDVTKSAVPATLNFRAPGPEQTYVLSSQVRRAMGLEALGDDRELGLSDVAAELLAHANTHGRAMSILEGLFPNNDVDDFHDAIAGAGHHQGRYEPPPAPRPYQNATRRGR